MRKLIAANWKMNTMPEGALGADSPYRPQSTIDVVVFSTFFDLKSCIDSGLTCGGQYGRAEEKGAFTGDISMAMLKRAGAMYVLCGHSERRRYHEESIAQIGEQLKAALDCGLTPILCIGESEDDNELQRTETVLTDQLKTYTLDKRVIVAYEPVWAIGSGKTPTSAEIATTHAFLRSLAGKDIRLLYGGSVSAKNAAEILSLPNVDGALVGGASLKPAQFAQIVSAGAQ